MNLQCWGKPIAYNVREFGFGLSQWFWMVSYGHPKWPSRSEWIVPGTHGWM